MINLNSLLKSLLKLAHQIFDTIKINKHKIFVYDNSMKIRDHKVYAWQIIENSPQFKNLSKFSAVWCSGRHFSLMKVSFALVDLISDLCHFQV